MEEFKRGLIATLIVFAIFYGLGYLTGEYGISDSVNSSSNSSSSSSNSNSSSSKSCLWCGNSFSGSGWGTALGEQYQSSDGTGRYCSRKCAYESQPKKWKR